MSSRFDTRERPRSIDLVAGVLAGATATVVTYPLEILQTRLQSSNFSFRKIPTGLPMLTFERNVNLNMCSCMTPVRAFGLVSYAESMIRNEGFSFFSRGLVPNVIGIAMSKGIYFPLYSSCKKFLRDRRHDNQESSFVHVCSAAFAGFANCTLTNPIWFLKTRLQLDSNNTPRTLSKMLVTIYRNEGLRVFYSGLTASYLGIAETVIHFTIYEHLQSIIVRRRKSTPAYEGRFYISDYVIAAAVSKTIATILVYPHEVLRTRMREQENREKSFLRLFRTIRCNEGWQGFYGGLATHLIRQVPNTAIVFLTYESIIYFGTQLMKVRTSTP